MTVKSDLRESHSVGFRGLIKYWVLLAIVVLVLAVSGIKPHDYFTWFLEVMPGIIGVLILAFTFKKFRFTYWVYTMVAVHCIILFVGGHYTYAEVPLFDWIKEIFNQSRNNYDKVGHFAQGFVPAFIVRELFVRKQVVLQRRWLSFIVVSVCLSISVAYEFLEWLVAVVSGQSAEAFLGTQGYEWDTQSDMLYAMIGAICMVVCFSRLHDKQISKTKSTSE
jgi:putative membrane protein